MDLKDIIWVDPERMGGRPCFRGTRIPVDFLFDYLEDGYSVDDFFEAYPDLDRELVRTLIRLQRQSVEMLAA